MSERWNLAPECIPALGNDDLAERWYAVHTRSRFEKKVKDELSAKGIEAYLPLVEEPHQWKDRQRMVQTPIFSGYVFVHMQNRPASRLQILTTAGTVRILGQGGGIEAIPDAQIESIRSVLASGTPFVHHPFLRCGAWVRVKSGAFAGVEGILTMVRNKTRLVLSVEMLCQSIAVEIDAARVEVIRPPVENAGFGSSQGRPCIRI